MLEPDLPHLTIWGAPRTKKNSQRVVRGRKGPIPLPSRAYEAWAHRALFSPTPLPRLEPHPWNVQALVWRDANRGDLLGYLQAIADLLQAAGVVPDDRWLLGWDGSRLLVDREQPRVEIWFRPLPNHDPAPIPPPPESTEGPGSPAGAGTTCRARPGPPARAGR